jgi:KaiC/GvpD/RAD55 family RecA-like ATPase
MVKAELVQRSPMRIFEQSVKGGLKAGELGLIAAPSGIGKTSVLVQIAFDKLLQDEKVIHISFTRDSDNVIVWYKDIFEEFLRKKNLENAEEVKNAAVKNRVLMNFNQEGFAPAQILSSVRAMMKEGGFDASALIIDGFAFSPAAKDFAAALKSFAKEMNVSIWCSCNAAADSYDKQNIPAAVKDYADLLDLIIVLEQKPDHIALVVSKNRSAPAGESARIKLDPKTLLIQG